MATEQAIADPGRGIRLSLVVLVAVSLAAIAIDVKASDAAASPLPVAVKHASPSPAPTLAAITPAPPVVAPAARTTSALAVAIASLVADSGATVEVSLAELGGSQPLTWSMNGDTVVDAASTYKLAALMLEAQHIAAGTVKANGLVYYTDADYEDGYFDDYVDGEGYSRSQLAYRAAHYSDNTAGHMLVRDVGGSAALNAWAAASGADSSSFFDGNTTTASDLTDLWVAEARGRLGGAAAQAWLYPLLTGTLYETGIPAGTPGATVVHKTGAVDATEIDTALVVGLPSGPYVLSITTDGLDGTAGPQLVSSLASEVRTFEASRPAA